MSLKALIDTLEGVPEAAHALYTERADGKFALSVEGMVPKGRLDEFRDNNLTLKQQLDALRGEFDGIDPAEARKLLDQASKARDKRLIDAGKVDELVAERVGAMQAEHVKVTGGLTSERDALRTQLQGLVVDGAIRDAATKAGVRATAIEDALLRGRAVFRLSEGKAVAMDGDKPLFGKTGEPMEIAEWIGGLATSAPHLFEASTGSGAKGGNAHLAPGTISRDDKAGFLANLDQIAGGKLRVA